MFAFRTCTSVGFGHATARSAIRAKTGNQMNSNDEKSLSFDMNRNVGGTPAGCQGSSRCRCAWERLPTLFSFSLEPERPDEGVEMRASDIQSARGLQNVPSSFVERFAYELGLKRAGCLLEGGAWFRR